MNVLLGLLVLVSGAFAQDVPFYLRDTKANQDMGGLNKNLSDLTIRTRNNSTDAITPDSCPVGQALTGAYFKNNGTSGGTCKTVAVTDGPVTLAGPVTITASAFSLGGSLSNGWDVPLASGTFSNVSTVTVTGLISSATIRCLFSSRPTSGNTSSLPYLVFNQAGSVTFNTGSLYYTSLLNLNSTAASEVLTNAKYIPTVADTHTASTSVGKNATSTTVEFSSVDGTSTTVSGFISSRMYTTTAENNSGAFWSQSGLAGTSLTDLEFFYAAANEGGGGTLISGKYFCYKRLE